MIRRIAAVAALLMAAAGPAGATTLTLDTGKAVTMAPGASGTFRFSATNDAGAITADFLGWAMGFQVRPSGVTSGSLTIGSLSQSPVNPMPVGDLEFNQPLLLTLANTGTINGSTQFWAMSAASLDTLGTIAGSTSVNLGDLGITASPSADGVWNVYAVQQADPFAKTYWNNAVPADVQFGNLPQSAGNSSVLIGTITVTAVPEPSTMSLAGFAVVAAGWVARRRSRRAN